MADQSKKQNNKRLNEDGDELQQKHQKRNENEENSVNATKPEPKSITNIYYDCLERIFEFLDLESLLNVAGTCKRLQIAAAAKFGDDYGGKTVMLTVLQSFRGMVSGIREEDDIIVVYNCTDLKICFPFLRCFGAKVSHLYVFYPRAGVQIDRLDCYINQYCADTLTSISFFRRFSPFTIGIFPKPFKNVTKVSIQRSNLGNQLPNFVNWFPNLYHMQLGPVKAIDESALAVSFPHLEKLQLIITDVNTKADSLSVENATKLLRANSQLKDLAISVTVLMAMNLAELLNMISENPSILKLKVCITIKDVSVVNLNRFANEHPTIKELIFKSEISADDAIMFIRQLNSLERFQFPARDRSECDHLLNRLDAKWQHQIDDSFGEIFITLTC